MTQRGRTVWTIANAPDALYREHFIRVLTWVLATTPLWIAGAAANNERRLLYWGLAAAIDLFGTWLAHPISGRRLHSEQVEFAGGHMLERCRLCLIIALGETVLTTGTAIAAAPMTVTTVIAGTAVSRARSPCGRCTSGDQSLLQFSMSKRQRIRSAPADSQ